MTAATAASMKPATPALREDFFEIMSRKDDFIGRDFMMRHMGGKITRGPIADIRFVATKNELIIEMSWEAVNRAKASQQADWQPYDDEPCIYGATLGESVIQFEEGDFVSINAMPAWVGRILGADDTLPKPDVKLTS